MQYTIQWYKIASFEGAWFVGVEIFMKNEGDLENLIWGSTEFVGGPVDQNPSNFSCILIHRKIQISAKSSH